MRTQVIVSICLLVALSTAQAQVDPDARITETVLHEFGTPPNGCDPYSGVIRDSGGNLYGTTYSGGTSNAGVVYVVKGRGRQTVLHNFAGREGDGANPHGALILDSAGNLYGTTVFDGKGRRV